MAKEENKVCARVCIDICGILDSPLLIGSGETEHTDMDVLVTSDGIPLIPGSAFAGSLRSYLEANIGVQETEDLFGSIGWGLRTGGRDQTQPEKPEYQSRIFVYDTLLKNAYMAVRDGVRLDEYKTSVETGKFDMQVVETGAQYELRLEIIVRDKGVKDNESLDEALKRDLKKINYCILGIRKGNLRLGAKNSRGFGKLKLNQVKYQIFKMDKASDMEAWLNWNWESESAFTGGSQWDMSELGVLEQERELEHCMRIPLQISNTILIRRYRADTWGKLQNTGEMQVADYGQLTLLDGSAVIPGSSWAGAVRSYLADLVKEIGELDSWEVAQKALEQFFGTWVRNKEEEAGLASRIIFDETIIKGGHKMPVMRNAIDRFTGGSADTALYGEILWAGGEVELEIRWSERGLKETEEQALCGMLLWAAYGLQNGFLAVGGETGVGRGIFLEKDTVCLDGVEIADSRKCLQAAANWCRRLKEE